MGAKLIYECDLCGKTEESLVGPKNTPDARKPTNWCFEDRKPDPRTGEKPGTNWFCSVACSKSHAVAWQAAFSSAEAKAMGLFVTSFRKELTRAKLVSRNAVDALAGLADAEDA